MSEELNLNLPPHLNNLNIKSPLELQLEKIKKKGVNSKSYPSTEEEKDFCEWNMKVNRQRDSYAGYLGDADLISFFAISENEAKARIRFTLLEKMLQPCGPPPCAPPPPMEKKKKGKRHKKYTDASAKAKT